jgi:phage terminase large subunit
MKYEGLDFKDPERVIQIALTERIEVLRRIRKDPRKHLPVLRGYYKDHIADFINDWGCTFDPKNVELGLPALVPFVLFPKQREWIDWLIDHWKTQRPGLTEKTRQMGMSWLTVATACSICLFHHGAVIGFGSRKQEYIDILGDPKSLLEKGRLFMRNLPKEFRGGWTLRDNAPHMRLSFPDTGSLISGEAGDNIGRGASTSLFFVDEAAFLERPHLVEASLSQTTNCRIDISTPNGMGNSFAQKRHEGRVDIFTMHWRDDPRKDDAWYQKQVAELDPVTVAAELDINYSASVEGILIPSAWVQSAIDAHRVLGISPTGARRAALDVADEGKDLNAFVGVRGCTLEILEEWSGAGDDIFGTVQRAFALCDVHQFSGFRYDADGLGAGVRGDARILNQGRKPIIVDAFRGSGGVHLPEGEDVKGRKNQDYFANAKAQAWWALRTRFQKTYRWIRDGEVSSFDDIISLPKDVPNLMKLVSELSQPVYHVSLVGKIVVDKAPDGVRSPNLADALMIRFAPGTAPMKINPAVLQRSREIGYHRLMA